MKSKTLLKKLFTVLGIASLVFLVGCGGSTSQSVNNQLPPPPAHQFASTGNLVVSQVFHSSTLLPDGRVLIACGITVAVVPTGEGELFDPVSGTFRSFAATPRRFCTLTLLPNGKVLIAGGSTDQTARNTAELFEANMPNRVRRPRSTRQKSISNARSPAREGRNMKNVAWWAFPLFAGLIGCGGGSESNTPLPIVLVTPKSSRARGISSSGRES